MISVSGDKYGLYRPKRRFLGKARTVGNEHARRCSPNRLTYRECGVGRPARMLIGKCLIIARDFLCSYFIGMPRRVPFARPGWGFIQATVTDAPSMRPLLDGKITLIYRSCTLVERRGWAVQKP